MESEQNINIDSSSISAPTTENKPKTIIFYRIGKTDKWTDIPSEQRKKQPKRNKK